jgi:hypothetical protein
MSKAHLPPVPPANRPPGASPRAASRETDSKRPAAERDVNTGQLGQTANTRINTTHQGQQQDR